MLSCMIFPLGDAMMMRKDSLFKDWWDPAFQKLVNSRIYSEICGDIDDPNVHGKNVEHCKNLVHLQYCSQVNV